MADAKKSTQWKPGQSGNASGRPRGARHRSTELLERLMLEDARSIVGAVVTRALAGDITAAKLILDRLLPAPRDRHLSIDLPACADAAGVAAAQAAVIDAVAVGELRPSEGVALADLLELRRRAIETTDLEIRLAALELDRAISAVAPGGIP